MTSADNDFFSIDNSKSYATEKTLHEKVQKLFGDKAKYLVVRNRAGRYTAIFGLSWNPGLSTAPVFHGYMVVA
jgi:hypothetical protein